MEVRFCERLRDEKKFSGAASFAPKLPPICATSANTSAATGFATHPTC